MAFALASGLTVQAEDFRITGLRPLGGSPPVRTLRSLLDLCANHARAFWTAVVLRRFPGPPKRQRAGALQNLPARPVIPGKISADSRRLLQFRGPDRGSSRGILLLALALVSGGKLQADAFRITSLRPLGGSPPVRTLRSHLDLCANHARASWSAAALLRFPGQSERQRAGALQDLLARSVIPGKISADARRLRQFRSATRSSLRAVLPLGDLLRPHTIRTSTEP